MGFGLEHQIKSTSGVGVNGGSESPEAHGSNSFHFICRRAASQETGHNLREPGARRGRKTSARAVPGHCSPQANGLLAPNL